MSRWGSALYGSASLMLVAAGPVLAQPADAAKAAADPLAGFYGNTLRIEVDDYYGLRFYEPDHTYRDRVRGEVIKGTWAIDGDRICTQSPGAQRFCNLGLAHKAGESWSDSDPFTGNRVTFTLVEGRQADR